MSLKKKIDKKIEGLRSSIGRDTLTFFIFWVIAAIFWFVLALNDDVQRDFNIPVNIENFPDNVTLLSDYDPTLNVTIKDKSSSLMQSAWGKTPIIKLRYEDFSRPNDSTLLLNSGRLSSAIRNIFGTGASIIAMRPDSLRLTYTTRPGIKVPLHLDCEINTLSQFIESGAPYTTTDSVMLYSNSPEIYNLASISTKPIKLTGLNDTTKIEVAVNTPPGIRAMPPKVNVTIPVEPLVARQVNVPIETRNVPEGERIVTFPGIVEVTYLIQKSLYHNDASKFRAYVDYSDIESGKNTLPIHLKAFSSKSYNVATSASSVEYVIEKQN